MQHVIIERIVKNLHPDKRVAKRKSRILTMQIAKVIPESVTCDD